MIKSFAEILSEAKKKGPKTVVVAGAQDEVVIEALAEGRKEGLVEGILVGKVKKLKK